MKLPIPDNVDKVLLAAARETGATPETMRETATRFRKLGRSLPMSDPSRDVYLMDASQYKRVAQYMERGGA